MARESDLQNGGQIVAAFGLKSAIGKSTTIRLIGELCDVIGKPWTGVSVDRSERLPDRYPGRFAQVLLPSDRDGRLDPYARTRAFFPLDTEIARLIETAGVLLLDIGSGEYPGAVLEHAARARLDALVGRSKISIGALILTTADATVMADVPRLIAAVIDALPAAHVTVVLNEKNGPFSFAANSEAQKVWRRDLEPLLAKFPNVTIPALPPGTWDPYEDCGLHFSEVGLLDPAGDVADERKLVAWSHEPRSLAIARQGDVAAWLHDAWQALAAVVDADLSAGGDDAR